MDQNKKDETLLEACISAHEVAESVSDQKVNATGKDNNEDVKPKADEMPLPEMPLPKTPSPKKKKTVLLILITCLIVVAGIIAFFFYQSRNHEHVYDNPCDPQCNECEETRTIQHTYANDADLYCDVCKGYRLVGNWSTTIEDQPGEITLNADGTGTVITHKTDRSCTWVVHEDGTLTVEQNINGIPYTLFNRVSFMFEGNTLILTSQSGNVLFLTGK